MMKYLKKFSPSAWFLLTFTVALCLSWVFPMKIPLFKESDMLRFIGVAVLLTSLTLNVLAMKEFHKHTTPHAPFETPQTLITTGVFSFSRNPVYLALVLSDFGLGFIMNTLWLFIAALVLLFLLHYFVVREEETLLKEHFKDEFTTYIKRTHRWL